MGDQRHAYLRCGIAFPHRGDGALIGGLEILETELVGVLDDGGFKRIVFEGDGDAEVEVVGLHAQTLIFE